MRKILGVISILFSVMCTGLLVWIHLFIFEKKLDGNMIFLLLPLIGVSKILYLIFIGLIILFFGLGLFLLMKKKKNQEVSK
ncbi:hypothetical protein [Thermoflavimicrobium dichotomicum]|uniref:Uncharacterized protein n=1 Tax=Thermoflavimicrobium dichotomicum TaxID=46223 RepID=A0A1I3T0G2_9BACL|nr:hypothetical protein [Thermoflavimicrobium dichotomicum]SFJ64150.1 hypothetical protein SAMN05421852_1151 [Thermoflavimicrobium dichotomicum]